KAVLAQRPSDPPRAIKRPRGEQRVDAPHRFEIVVIDWTRLAVNARARHAKHRALPTDRQVRMGALELGSTVRRAHLTNLLAKKSFSIVSWPILACSFSISRADAASASVPILASNARAALSRSCFFHA